jgi:hypothetical protein
LLVAASVLGSVATFVPSAHATDIDTDVGGGVAPIIAVVGVGSDYLYDLGQEETTELTIADPQAVLPPNGGSFKVAALDQQVGPVHARALSGSITGRRDGTPFADASTSVADVTVGSVKFGTVSTHCRWDTNGATASTTIQLGVIKTYPKANNGREIPGLGYVIENEQYVDTIYATDANGNYIRNPDGSVQYYQTKVVVGLHVHLNPNLENLYSYSDLYIGFASCDPLSIPNLSGLKQFSPST